MILDSSANRSSSASTPRHPSSPKKTPDVVTSSTGSDEKEEPTLTRNEPSSRPEVLKSKSKSSSGEARVDDSSLATSLSINDAKSLTDISIKRQKLVRQQSFEIDSSDDADDLDSVVEITSKREKLEKAKILKAATEKAKPEKIPKPEKTLKPEKTPKPAKTPKVSNGPKKRPDLTIKICDSSFDAGSCEPDLASEAFRSPSLHISGISISRSPPGVPVHSASLSPKYQIHLPPATGRSNSAALTVASAVNRNR